MGHAARTRHIARQRRESRMPRGLALTGGGCSTGTAGHRLELSSPRGGDNRWACRSDNVSGSSSLLLARAISGRVPRR